MYKKAIIDTSTHAHAATLNVFQWAFLLSRDVCDVSREKAGPINHQNLLARIVDEHQFLVHVVWVCGCARAFTWNLAKMYRISSKCINTLPTFRTEVHRPSYSSSLSGIRIERVFMSLMGVGQNG